MENYDKLRYITNNMFHWKMRSCSLPQTRINVYNTSMNWDHKVKYLEAILDPKLSFNIILLINIIRILHLLICRKSLIIVTNKNIFLKCTFNAVIFYAAPLCSNCASSPIKKLQVAQNKLFKLMCSLLATTPQQYHMN